MESRAWHFSLRVGKISDGQIWQKDKAQSLAPFSAISRIIAIGAIAILLQWNVGNADPQLPMKGIYKLPLQGSYGNDSGCNALSNREPVSDDMRYITKDEYKGWESSCSFVAAFEGWSREGDKSWTVVTSCGAEGMAYSELITVHEQSDLGPGERTVTITDERSFTPDNEPVVLKACK